MLQAIKALFHQVQKHRRRQIFRQGQTLSRFVARNIRRDVMILADADIDSSFITARIRTVNVLYMSRHLVPLTLFGLPEQVAVNRLWNWRGQPWGRLSDRTSTTDLQDDDPTHS
ncbi:hypothetical protein [Acaryochloris sp. CCMEE 5410]|uniref:hypothetical protein n=1 Tax=Acaryochloris sp. CCMEE 5410 TaxID=310037 RepID=UPI00024852D2|nr:hypothetical protein [Acaryochloris sp. CCMEE 5410]KAI9135176.1 hypothetical protein ON05_019350 [Acaryochloris sp. CCMEE 5410]